jgi:DNA-binding transcriptional MerR regulator
LTLAAIGRVVRGELGDADADLAAAVAAELGQGRSDEAVLTLDEFAARSGVPASLIQAVEREGIRVGRSVDGETRYAAADIEIVRTALRLLEFGLPLPDLLGLAKDTDRAIQGLADRAVELFDRHVREPIRDSAEDAESAADQLVEAFRELLPAVTALVAHHFRRVLLEAAEARFEHTGRA